MKKLLLIRHAKATHETGYKDFERPLQPSGLRDAALMAARLQEHGLIPELLVSSPALRTISTANVFSEHLSIPKAEEIKSIYEAESEDLMEVIQELPDKYDFIGLVGHNPGMSRLLYQLTSQAQEVPTCAVALIEFDIKQWGGVTTAGGKLVYYDYPKS